MKLSLIHRTLLLALVTASASVGCTAEVAEQGPGDQDEGDVAITSNDGKLFDFKFQGEVVASRGEVARQAIVAQLQYVQGALTTDVRGNGQIGLVTLSGVTETVEGETKRIKYTAVLPVVWPKETATPRRYSLSLPRDVTALSAFNARYDGKCGKNEYGVDTFWHDFNPKAPGCSLDTSDTLKVDVKVQRSAQATQGRFPEYDQVLADDAIDVVAVFGIISSNTPGDEGAVEMENVIAETQRGLTDAVRKDSAATATVIKSTLLTGKVTVAGRARSVSLTALLTSEVAGGRADFDAIYGPASEKADLIVYSGHSGLGKNINALSEKTRVKAGKYQILYLNGCQSFAYMGRALHDKKSQVNGASKDPLGTKYLDVVANALPAYGDNGSTGLVLYRALLGQDTPKTYNDILKDFSRIHLAAVFGEDDNSYRPR